MSNSRSPRAVRSMTIGTRGIGDTLEHARLQLVGRWCGEAAPQVVIGEARDVAHVDPGTDHAPSRGDRFECGRDQRPGRREDDRGVELFGWPLVTATGPDRAQRARELLGAVVSPA